MVLSVLDLGSNSFHLVTYRVRERRRGRDQLEKRSSAKEMCRLGSSIGDGSIDDDAWRRGMSALDRLVRRARAEAADRFVAVATSALRDADNGAAFCRAARRRHGLAIDVLSGEEEARLVYLGARETLPRRLERAAVIDVGGGSAEIAAGDRAACRVAVCLPLGVLRLRDLGADRVAAHVRTTARDAMARVAALEPERVVMTSGSARRLAGLALGLGLRRDDERELTREAIAGVVRVVPRLAPRDLEALGVEEGRRDTILHGAIAYHTLLELGGFDGARVAQGGLREGVALRELGRAPSSTSRRPAKRAA